MTNVIKVKKETARELTKVVGKLTMEKGRKVSYDDAIKFLLERERAKKSPADMKRLIEKSFLGASSDDFREYGYGDI